MSVADDLWPAFTRWLRKRASFTACDVAAEFCCHILTARALLRRAERAKLVQRQQGEDEETTRYYVLR